jgi:hypothetical protein
MHKFTIVIAMLAGSLAAFQANAADREPLQNNQVKLSVVRYEDHVQFDCVPRNADTASRNDWRSICNEMAAPQISKLVHAGIVTPVKQPIFDSISGAAKMLSRSVPLSRKHL